MFSECRSHGYGLLFKVIENGDLANVRRILSNFSSDELNECLNCASVNETTPLVVAARHGHVGVVEYLLSLNADPSACGTVSFDGEVIPKVPPLWAAATAGHLRICEILIARNVDVNQTSSTSSTPVRGACYDGYIDIVKFLVAHGADIEIPNRHGHTSLMISCYRGKLELVDYLLSIGALVNRRSIKGNTALHDAAEIGSVQIVRRLLLAEAKMLPDEYGLTPLLTAALHGHTDVLAQLFAHASRAEQRNAWKLLGATMVDRRNDLAFAVACWRTAYTADFFVLSETISGITSAELPDVDELPQLSETKRRFYRGHREVRCAHDVQELIGDPEAIRTQALLIRERLLGDAHPETHYYLRCRGAEFCDADRWDRAFEYWLYILQLEQYYLPPLNIIVMCSFVTFAEAFTSFVDAMAMLGERVSQTSESRVSLEQIVIIIDRALYEAERYLRSDEEPEADFHDYDIRQEIEKLLNLILHYLHLASRVHALNAHKEDRRLSVQRASREMSAPNVPTPLVNAIYDAVNVEQLLAAVSGLSIENLFESSALSASSSGNLSAPRSSLNAESQSASSSAYLAPTNVPSSSGLSSSSLPSNSSASNNSAAVHAEKFDSLIRDHVVASQNNLRAAADEENQPYVFQTSHAVPPLCERAFLDSLTAELVPEPKTHLPLRPKCSHFKCLMRRIIVVFQLLKMNPLHMACQSHPTLEIRKAQSRFVVERLLEAGADPLQIDEYDNTALHIFLSDGSIRYDIAKLLLDAGVPLLARNMVNETCLDLIIRKTPALIKHLNIGQYLSLKQIAANVVMRNLSGTKSFEGILPRQLEEFIAIF